jgi:polysaccharide export outer membrane protein
MPLGPVGLKPGDAIRVSIWREPDLSGEFMVARNGKVVFPLLGEKEVAGRSPDDVQARLTADYQEYLENPSVEVTVLRRIAILGEVRNPSLYMVDPTVTLTEALALAGGVSPTGNKDDIRLVRGDQVLVQSMDGNQVIGATPIQSGDQIVVGQQSWARRNVTFITAGLGAVTSILVAMILVAGH